MTDILWNVPLYQRHHSFVWEHGQNLVDVLAPTTGETILDLGCGTGKLTNQIAWYGANAIGLDNSPEMISAAKTNYPNLEFRLADANSFQTDRTFDAIFSNAVLHWLTSPVAAIRCMRRALKLNGRLVVEFGGHGNVGGIVTALSKVLADWGIEFDSPWYFPKIGEYTQLLEANDFEVVCAELRDRPTSLVDGEEGLANWLNMFAGSALNPLSTQQRQQTIERVQEIAKQYLYRDRKWCLNYRRIRIVAIAQ